MTTSLDTMSLAGRELSAGHLDGVDGGFFIILVPGFVIAAALGLDVFVN